MKYSRIIIVVCAVLSVSPGVMHTMNYDSTNVLKSDFNRNMNEYQEQIAHIPTNFDQSVHGRIIQYDAHDQFNIVVTLLGGMYCSDGDTWLQVHANEYENEQQFLDEKIATKINFKDAIHKQKFNLYHYDPATKMLVYPTHQVSKYQRNPFICMQDHRKNLYPKRIRFESPEMTCNYDLQLVDNSGNVQKCVRNDTGEYYAISGITGVIIDDIRLNPIRYKRYVKVIKKISNNSFGDDSSDLLTQGDDQKTKAFIIETIWSDRIRNIYFRKHIYGDHIHFLTDIDSPFSIPMYSYYIISPIYGKTLHKVFVDCGDNNIVPFKIVNCFEKLEKSLIKSNPKACIRDTRFKDMVGALWSMPFPRELKQKIMYDLIYMDKALIENTLVLYGTDNVIFPKDQKEALHFFNNFSTHMGTMSFNFEEDHIKAKAFLENHEKEGQSDKVLWNALYYGRCWGKDYLNNMFILHLLGYIFTKVRLSEQNVFSIGVGNNYTLIEEINGALKAPPYVIRQSWFERYHLLKKRKNWGTREDIKQYVYDNRIKEVVKDADGYFVAVCNDGTTINLP